MEITLGWSLIPIAITVISFVIANRYDAPRGGGYINADFEGLFRFTFGFIVSLIAWLVYALAT
jgi:hypothetical protein